MQTHRRVRNLALPCARAVGQLTVLLALLASLNACSTLTDALTPGERNSDPQMARVALQANIAAQVGAPGDVVSLQVLLSYVRRDGSWVRTDAQTRTLTEAELQSVPIGVDVAPCLADPAREGGGGSCFVVLQLALLVNGNTVDEQVIGPLQLTPGQSAATPQPVSLFELAGIEILDVSGNAIPSGSTIELALGAERALRAQVRDTRGQLVSDRVPVWSTDAPQVASISSTGTITTVGIGTARFTAALGARSVSVSLNVVRPTATLAIVGAPGSGRGVVRSTPEGIECRVNGANVAGTCSFEFPGDASVTLLSIPDDGNLFGVWGGECAAFQTDGACVITMSSARQASARFTVLRRFTVSAALFGDGRGRVTGSAGIDCLVNAGATSGTCSAQVPDGQEITLSATEAPSSSGGDDTQQSFGGWSGACSAATGSTCTVVVSSDDQEVGVRFFDQRLLTVNVSGTGGGLVRAASTLQCTRSLAGETSGACAAAFVHALSVTLSAESDESSQFVEWSGACNASSSPTCTVSMTEARTVTASFVRRRVTLTLLADGSRMSAGQILLNGVEACAVSVGAGTSNCKHELDAGTSIALRGVAGVRSSFSGFSGGCSGTADCEFVINDNRVVRADFAGLPVILAVVASPPANGDGRVVSAGVTDGIDCTYSAGLPGDTGCDMLVPLSAQVSLTATANPGSALVSWGEACAGVMTRTCTIQPTAASEVYARFVAAIDVNMEINGAGVVSFDITGVPVQENCASASIATCRYSLPIGMTGTFRAMPAAGYVFSGFRGPCLEGTGLVQTCTYRGFGFVRRIEALFVRQ